jgi:hypothetical protein
VNWGGLLSSEQNDEECEATKMLRELKLTYIKILVSKLVNKKILQQKI